ncbi:MAG: hypothetical protein WBN04_15575 [Paracoccaceae bacterium]
MGYAVRDIVPPTPKQVTYARQIASKLHAVIPWESANDRRALSDWISRHQEQLNRASQAAAGSGATSKQVAFAEQLARRKRLAVPDECFRDAGLMSRWIDSHR